MHRFPQTNLQLYRHLAELGYAAADIASAGRAYELALELFPGTYRGSGKPFLAHLVGTAGIAVLRALRMKGHTSVVALKATGTPAVAELSRYQDFGAAQVFHCVDFGFPTTYPVGRKEISDLVFNELDFCFSLPAGAVLIECAGDPVSANAPEFLTCLKARRSDFKIILAAADALGAMGAKQALAEIGLVISLITGPCTDTPILREWTEGLCGIPAINLFRSSDDGTQSHLSGVAALE